MQVRTSGLVMMVGESGYGDHVLSSDIVLDEIRRDRFTALGRFLALAVAQGSTVGLWLSSRVFCGTVGRSEKRENASCEDRFPARFIQQILAAMTARDSGRIPTTRSLNYCSYLPVVLSRVVLV